MGAASEPWAMPEWMESYRDYIRNTGGNTVEELVNDQHSSLLNNGVRAALCVAVKSQVSLLAALHADGRLVTPQGNAIDARQEGP